MVITTERESLDKEKTNVVLDTDTHSECDNPKMEITMTATTKRESGLELLRIIAMLLIVMFHVNLYGSISTATNSEQHLLQLVGAGGKLGVNVFVLISAYFMVNKKFKPTRILNIVLQTTLYSLIFYALFTIFGNVKFTIKSLVYAILPVFYKQYWFVTAYIILMFLSPALNIIIHSVNQKILKFSLLGIASYTVLFPYLSRILTGGIFEVPFLNEVFIFMELYCIGGYIRLYGINLKKFWVILITFSALAFGITLTYFNILGGWRELGLQIGSFSNFVGAIGLLLIFKDFKFKSRIINTIASTTFGIYLIHENSYMRKWEYQFCREHLFPWVTSSALMFLLLVTTVFVLCMVIDFIRLQTIHRLTNKVLHTIDKKAARRKTQSS